MGTGAASARRRSRFAMNFRESVLEVGDEAGERSPQGRCAGDDHIVETGLRPRMGPGSQRLSEAAANTVADDRRAEALGDGETESRAGG